MNFLRTPDPNPGWLNEDDLQEARRRLPMVYVQALPVRLDPLGYLSEIGLLLTANDEPVLTDPAVPTTIAGKWPALLSSATIRSSAFMSIVCDWSTGTDRNALVPSPQMSAPF